jgi:hypothetical protein
VADETLPVEATTGDGALPGGAATVGEGALLLGAAGRPGCNCEAADFMDRVGMVGIGWKRGCNSGRGLIVKIHGHGGELREGLFANLS